MARHHDAAQGFRGRVAGFLTRLSATGLANVTSGGGQVPAFIVESKA